MKNSYDVVIVGGGAAGYFAAINCAINFPKYKIAILEKHNKVLQKVLISGGGRCNVTHNVFDNRLLTQNYPRGQKELLSVFNLFDVQMLIDWFKERSVELKVEPDGRVFPKSDSSMTIIQSFIDEANKLKIDLLLKQEVKHIFNHENQFEIITESNEFNSRFVIITIGGFHKFDAYSWLIQLGHKIIKPVPSLFTFNIEEHLMKHLMGISVRGAKVKIMDTKQEFVGDILITHWGFSGPVVLKLSSFAAIELNKLDYNYEVLVNWINEKNTEEVRFQLLEYKEKHYLKNIENELPYDLPKRLWLYFFELIDLPPNTKWAEVPNKKINHLVEVLCNSRYKAKGKTTNKEEFVTSGGVDLKEVEMKTLESKKQKNLFFAGEVLNIDGITGGFNFQAAWSTAYLAAKLGNHDFRE